MNRLNAKRIGVLAASLLFGLAVAGPVTYSNIPIITSAGQPVVQIVVGSTAQPSDGVVAANIAAVIGNLAFTSTPVTATVSGAERVRCVVTTATCSVSNQQVWLGESGISAPSGSYGFTALIGSVLNRAVALGSPTNTKFLAGTASAVLVSRTATRQRIPADSPLHGSGICSYFDQSCFIDQRRRSLLLHFTISCERQPAQITSAQLPSLLSNAGAYGEIRVSLADGIPCLRPADLPSVQNFALMNAGGAYQATFNKPIHEPYYATEPSANSTGNSVNNAAINLLGQNWTIVSYTLPSAALHRSSTTTINGGKLGLATSLVPLTTVYVGQNLTSGPFTVQLSDLGQLAAE